MLGLCRDGDVDGGLAGAALGVEKVEQDLKLCGASSIAQKSPLPLLFNEPFLAQRIQVMRKGGSRDSELIVELADDEPGRMRGEKETDDGDPGLVP